MLPAPRGARWVITTHHARPPDSASFFRSLVHLLNRSQIPPVLRASPVPRSSAGIATMQDLVQLEISDLQAISEIKSIHKVSPTTQPVSRIR